MSARDFSQCLFNFCVYKSNQTNFKEDYWTSHLASAKYNEVELRYHSRILKHISKEMYEFHLDGRISKHGRNVTMVTGVSIFVTACICYSNH